MSRKVKRNNEEKSITQDAYIIFLGLSLLVIAIEVVHALRVIVRAAKDDLLTHKL
jgi:hypothetical protein